ncbi:predicted protein [Botrytis cinerea T4]|uniref:Uncharacterized protein n=1 Tax=Botryotinia fuckeliana (strain T4) TaxID=999810 RepID=G2YZE7_BOTF4|nr:predicted protein [Botrytis cinerea T4]
MVLSIPITDGIKTGASVPIGQYANYASFKRVLAVPASYSLGRAHAEDHQIMHPPVTYILLHPGAIVNLMDWRYPGGNHYSDTLSPKCHEPSPQFPFCAWPMFSTNANANAE